MPEPHILVCLKVVPKPEEIRVDPESLRLIREGARSEINPPDMNALEMALEIKEKHGARVSLLSMGPPLFEPYLRVALAMGADAAYLLSDERFGGADTLATTYTLAAGIRKLQPVDLILCGEESSDGATGQVPAGLAEWLDCPQITLVSELHLDVQDGTIRGRRQFGASYEVLEVPLPAVVSVKTASNEPRFMDYELKPWAFEEAPVIRWGFKDLELEGARVGAAGSPTVVSRLKEATLRERKRARIDGSTQEITRQLVELMGSFLE